MERGVIESDRVTIGDSHITGDRKFTIFGNPLHKNQEVLEYQYASSSITQFLAFEARHSVGNYILVDVMGNVNRIITSVGYNGGYLDCTTDNFVVADTIRDLTPAENLTKEYDVNPEALLHYFRRGPYNMLPFQTPFEGVVNLPPGTIVEIKDDNIIRFESYLSASNSSGNKSFGKRLEEAVSAVNKRGKDQITLMLSGGVDSTAVLVALDNVIPTAEKVNVVSMFTGNMGGNPLKAAEIGGKLGYDVELIDRGMPISEQGVVEQTIEAMRYDFIKPNNPHWQLAAENRGEETIILGQSIDGLLTSGMSRPQLSQRDRLRKGDLQNKMEASAGTLFRHIIPNIQRTTGYQSSPILRFLFCNMIPPTYERMDKIVHRIYDKSPLANYSDFESDYTTDGIFQGLLSTGYPNFVSESNLSAHSIEIEQFYKFVSGDSDIQNLFDLFYYYTHICQVNRLMSKFQPLQNASILPFIVSGPITDRYVGKERSVSTALEPKKEVYEYIQSKTEKSYYELGEYFELNRTTQFDVEWKEDIEHKLDDFDRNSVKSPLVETHTGLFDPTESELLSEISDTEIHREIKKLYLDSKEYSNKNRYEFHELKPMHRIINAELIYD